METERKRLSEINFHVKIYMTEPDPFTTEGQRFKFKASIPFHYLIGSFGEGGWMNGWMGRDEGIT